MFRFHQRLDDNVANGRFERGCVQSLRPSEDTRTWGWRGSGMAPGGIKTSEGALTAFTHQYSPLISLPRPHVDSTYFVPCTCRWRATRPRLCTVHSFLCLVRPRQFLGALSICETYLSNSMHLEHPRFRHREVSQKTNEVKNLCTY